MNNVARILTSIVTIWSILLFVMICFFSPLVLLLMCDYREYLHIIPALLLVAVITNRTKYYVDENTIANNLVKVVLNFIFYILLYATLHYLRYGNWLEGLRF